MQTLLEAEVDCNTVLRPGEIDDNKRDLFPVTEINIETGVPVRGSAVFTLTLTAVDIVDDNPETPDDKYIKKDDLHDILNAQFYVLARVYKQLDLQDVDYDIETDAWDAIYPSGQSCYAGWRGTFTITLDLGDLTAC